ncbi:SPARC-related modular calcium-binding protein 1-like isoform X3 [Liolophura sinensis]|uniref:SPARC-related modular calcium-binding protein 1-like isoform X3 n=1 Tax=Liolophura sinensis TaxID=3198878 RepID=UPI00315892DD
MGSARTGGMRPQHTWTHAYLPFSVLILLLTSDCVNCSGGTGIAPLQDDSVALDLFSSSGEYKPFITAEAEPRIKQLTKRQAFRNLRSTECKLDCSNVKRRPVCGSDGITYSSRCEIRRVKQCEGVNVKVKKKGECVGPGSKTGLSRCQQEREEARAVARRPTVGIFIPSCNKDGTYAEIQCHAATGYCWCATKLGKPITGTSLSEKKPDCKAKPKHGKSNKRGKRRGCSQTDRTTFNRNLIEVFTAEYNRTVNKSLLTTAAPPGQPSGNPADAVLDTPDKRVVEWKFSQLDKNSDNKLRKKEVRALKRLVKKLIKPRACAKNFVNYCDLDQDKKIIRREWSSCLGVTINRVSVLKSQAFKSFGLSTLLRPSNSDDTVEERLNPASSRASPGVLQVGPSLGNRQLNPSRTLITPEPSKTDNTEELRSCLEEREIAIKMDREDPEGKIFIPSCSKDGIYTKAQCHTSTEYCWCVDEKTGKPKPGTSTYKVKPNCDMVEERRMKGCPHSQKRRFVKDLVDHLTEEMDRSSGAPAGSSTGVRDKAFYEKVVRWKLTSMDKNGNEMLERKEWKDFKKNMRKTVGKKKSMRKCARNFLRYCDADKNKRISVDEWIDCTGVNRNMYSLPPNPKRKGPNPFSKYLRES